MLLPNIKFPGYNYNVVVIQENIPVLILVLRRYILEYLGTQHCDIHSLL